MSFVEALVMITLIICVTAMIWVALHRYSHHGKLLVEKDPDTGKTLISLELDIDPYEIEHMKNVSFKVVTKNVSIEESAD